MDFQDEYWNQDNMGNLPGGQHGQGNPSQPPPPPVTGGFETMGPITGLYGQGGGPTDFGSFNIPAYSGPYSPNYNFSQVPQFTAPNFGAPSWQDAMNEPGYQFRLRSGAGALEASAAAKGHLRTGGTLAGVEEYGQNFATQEYANVFNRALQAFQQRYQGAKDQYAPKFAQWQQLTQAEQARAMAEFSRYWDAYQFGVNANLQKEQLAANMFNQNPPAPPTH